MLRMGGRWLFPHVFKKPKGRGGSNTEDDAHKDILLIITEIIYDDIFTYIAEAVVADDAFKYFRRIIFHSLLFSFILV